MFAIENEDDATEISTLLLEAASYEVQTVGRILREMESGERTVGRHSFLSLKPWVERLDRTVTLLEKVLE